MIFNDSNEVVLGNAQQETQFRIAASPKAFKILSDNLYKNKIRAIIRETACNAIDAQVLNGNTRPFEITLPTALDPRFVIRDFGPGISPKDIIDVYTVYFMSTKTDSDEQIGGLGLGAKTPFSYSPTFNVTNFYNGMVYGYSAVLTENGPVFNKTFEAPFAEGDVSGLEVTVPVKANDLNVWNNEARYLLRTFGDAKPIVHNMTGEIDYFTDDERNQVMFSKPSTNDRPGIYAIFGRIVYPLTDVRGLSAGWLLSMHTHIYFNFDLSDRLVPAPSREELSLDDHTVGVLCDRINTLDKKLFDEAIQYLQEEPNVRKAARVQLQFTSKQRNIIAARNVVLSDGRTLNDVSNNNLNMQNHQLDMLLYHSRTYQVRKQMNPKRYEFASQQTRRTGYYMVQNIIDVRQDRVDILVADKKGKITSAIRALSYMPDAVRKENNLPPMENMVIVVNTLDDVLLKALQSIMGLDPVHVHYTSELMDKYKEYNPLYSPPNATNKKPTESRPASPNVIHHFMENNHWNSKNLRLTASELDALKGPAVGIYYDAWTGLDGQMITNMPNFYGVARECGITEFYALRPQVLERFKRIPNSNVKPLFPMLAESLVRSFEEMDVENYIMPNNDRFSASVEDLGLGVEVYGPSYGVQSATLVRTWSKALEASHSPRSESADMKELLTVSANINTLYGEARKRAEVRVKAFKDKHDVAYYYMDRHWSYSDDIKAQIYHLLKISNP